MEDLADTFGDTFVEEYEKEKQRRRQARERVSDEQLDEIANLAVNEGKFEGGEPNFRFETEEGIVNHVFLMELPDPQSKSIWSYVQDLDNDAVTCPLDYMGEWMSCLFNNPDDLKQLEPGDLAVVVGELDTWENEETGESNDQLSPVRGVMTISEAKKRADRYLDGVSGGSPAPEPVEDETTPDPEPVEEEDEEPSFGGGSSDDSDEEEDGDDGGSLFGGGDSSDDEEEQEEETQSRPFTEEEVRTQVNALGSREPEVWNILGNDDRIDKVVIVVSNELDVDDREWGDEIREIVVERLEEEQEEEEEEDEDEDALF